MTEFELAAELDPASPCRGLLALSRMSNDRIAGYARLVSLADEINLWSAGIGPKPEGVIICGPRQIKGARSR